MIVPKKHLARAAGIQQVGSAMQSILVPVLASAFLARYPGSSYGPGARDYLFRCDTQFEDIRDGVVSGGVVWRDAVPGDEGVSGGFISFPCIAPRSG